jgi:signal transduction histidine kinase
MANEEKNLEAEIDHLKKINDSKSHLISISAHELRTSLTATKWILQMLIDKEVGDLNIEQKKFLEKVFESNERAITVVNEMLSINHAEEVVLKYSFENIDILPIVENVISDFSGESRRHNKEIILLRPEKNPPKVQADAEKIKIIMQNLIENGLKYSNEGDKVFVTFSEKNSELEIRVKDNGIGIKKEDQDKIFNKYFRAENAKEKDKVGSGLGLTIIREMIEKHGGKIWFESEEGKGTTFYFTIPTTKAA